MDNIINLDRVKSKGDRDRMRVSEREKGRDSENKKCKRLCILKIYLRMFLSI